MAPPNQPLGQREEEPPRWKIRGEVGLSEEGTRVGKTATTVVHSMGYAGLLLVAGDHLSTQSFYVHLPIASSGTATLLGAGCTAVAKTVSGQVNETSKQAMMRIWGVHRLLWEHRGGVADPASGREGPLGGM